MAPRELILSASSFYQKVAGAYDSGRHQPFYRQIAAALLDKIPADVNPYSVLEVGAGCGFATAELARRFPTAGITALEPAAAMLARGRRRPIRAQWIGGTLLDLPGDDFDLVFASMSYQWLGDAERRRLLELAQGRHLALAVPVTTRRPRHEGNRKLLKLTRALNGRSQLPRCLRRPSALVAELAARFDRVEIYDGSVTERFANYVELAASLYERGALTALFGGAEGEARRQLEQLVCREEIEFHWPVGLIVAGGPCAGGPELHPR